MPPSITAHDWATAALVGLGAFALLGLVWYFSGDPDRSDRLRARFGSRYYLFYVPLALLSAISAVERLAARYWLDAGLNAAAALVWAWLAYRTRRDRDIKTPVA